MPAAKAIQFAFDYRFPSERNHVVDEPFDGKPLNE